MYVLSQRLRELHRHTQGMKTFADNRGTDGNRKCEGGDIEGRSHQTLLESNMTAQHNTIAAAYSAHPRTQGVQLIEEDHAGGTGPGPRKDLSDPGLTLPDIHVEQLRSLYTVHRVEWGGRGMLEWSGG
jgi:hypothetical protein